jgi:hypothetical protein
MLPHMSEASASISACDFSGNAARRLPSAVRFRPNQGPKRRAIRSAKFSARSGGSSLSSQIAESANRAVSQYSAFLARRYARTAKGRTADGFFAAISRS